MSEKPFSIPLNADASVSLRRVRHYALLITSLILLGLMVYAIEFHEFLDRLSRLDFATVSIVILAYGLTWLVRAFRLERLVDRPFDLLDAFRIQIAGFALNLIYPAKMGDLFMGAFLKNRLQIRYQNALAFILHLRVLDFFVLTLLGTISLWSLPANRVSPQVWRVMALGGSLLGVFCMAVLTASRTRFLESLSRILPERFDMTYLFRKLGSFHSLTYAYFFSILLTFLIWVLEIFTCFLIGVRIAPGISVWGVVSAMAMGNIMKALPLFPGGLGTYEAGFILLLTLHGASYETAVSLSILDHLIKKTVNLLVGFPVYLQLQKQPS